MFLFFRFCFEAAGKRGFGGRDTYFSQAVVLTFVVDVNVYCGYWSD
jgi:hypothetical protein